MLDIWKCFFGYIENSGPKILWVLMFSGLFYVIFTKIQKNKIETKYRIMFSLACSFIFVMTLFGRLRQDYGEITKPFESYLIAFSEGNAEQILQILMNIVMYIPFGIYFPFCFSSLSKCKCVVFMATVCSANIEVIQGIFNIGLFEVDDIMNNVLGAFIGALVYKIIVKKKYSKTK